MEAGSGAFSQDFGGDEDDPFAGSEQDFGLGEAEAARAADAALEAERGDAPLPVVDREGQRIDEPVQEPTQEQPVEDATQVAAEAAAAEVVADEAEVAAESAEAAAAVDPTPPSAPPTAPSQASEPEASASETGEGSEVYKLAEEMLRAHWQEIGQDPDTMATLATLGEQEAKGWLKKAEDALGEDPTSAAPEAGAPSAASEAPGEPAATPDPTSASSEAPGEAAGDESPAEAGDGASDDAAAPQEKEGGTKRQYKLFTPDGPGKFSEVSWHEKAGKVVEKGTAGAKKQTVVLARGQEDALSHGFAVLGAPQDGASLIAVAATYWQVKRVDPDPVQPIRQRLRIS